MHETQNDHPTASTQLPEESPQHETKVNQINEKLVILPLGQAELTLSEDTPSVAKFTVPSSDSQPAQHLTLQLQRALGTRVRCSYAFDSSPDDPEAAESILIQEAGEGGFLSSTLFVYLSPGHDSTTTVSLFLLQDRASSSQPDHQNNPEIVSSIVRRQEHDKLATRELPPIKLEVDPSYNPHTLTLKPGELGGIGPFDDVQRSDQEWLDFIHDDKNGITEVGQERFTKELALWQEMRARLQEADVIFLPMNEGIGDRLYHAGVAVELARHFPDKTIIFQTPDFQPFDLDATQLPNLQMVGLGQDSQGKARRGFSNATILDAIKDKRTFVLNLSVTSALTDVALTLDQLAQAGLATDSLPSELTIFDQATDPDLQPDPDKLIMTLWTSWSSLMLEPTSSRVWDLRFKFPEIKPQRLFTAHQVTALASKLHVLAGIPISADFPAFPIREIPIPDQAEYDYFFVYDAESQSGVSNPNTAASVKVIGFQTLSNTITEVLAQNPEARIAVVKGRSNPYIAEKVRAAFPNVTIVESSFQGVLAEGLKSDVIVTSDTGLGHYFEAQLQQCREPGYQGRQPRQYAFFASDSPFMITTYGLRYATNVMVEKDLFNVPANVILDPIE